MVTKTTSEKESDAVYRAVITRILCLLLLSTMFLLTLTYLIKTQHELMILSAFIFTSSTSLSNEWYYLAKSNFKAFLLRESIPRFVLTLLPLIAVKSIDQLTVLLLFLTLSNVAISLQICRNVGSFDRKFKSTDYSTQEKIRYSFLQLLGFVVLFSPVPLVNYFGFVNRFEFTVLEKFFRLFMTAIIPISQIAHSQLLSSNFRINTSQSWYRLGHKISLAIALLYVPCLVSFLLIMQTLIILKTAHLLILLLGILIVVTFESRIIEEIFVINLNQMRLINTLQFISLVMLLLLFSLACYLKSSPALLISLILSEALRFQFMRFRLLKSQVLN